MNRRTCRVIALLALPAAAHAGEIRNGQCIIPPIFDEVNKAGLRAATMNDFWYHGDASDAKFTAAVESGKFPAGKVLADGMKTSAAHQHDAALSVPAIRVHPILSQAAALLGDARFPKLTFLLIAPPEAQAEGQAFADRFGAHFIFVPYDDRACAAQAQAASAQDGSGRTSLRGQ